MRYLDFQIRLSLNCGGYSSNLWNPDRNKSKNICIHWLGLTILVGTFPNWGYFLNTGISFMANFSLPAQMGM